MADSMGGEAARGKSQRRNSPSALHSFSFSASGIAALAGLDDGSAISARLGARELRHADPGRGLAVEADRAQLGQRGGEFGERVGLGLADRGVEAAGAMRRGDGVPQADFRRRAARRGALVIERLELDADDLADQVPEAVLRMRIIPPAPRASARPAGCRAPARACRARPRAETTICGSTDVRSSSRRR